MLNTRTLYAPQVAAALLGATFLSGGQAAADQVIADDLIVQGSICVGFDCVNGEIFGADTLRLKENNLRIHFDDTSNSGSFPNNDWRIVINDSANGGANYFAIEDATAGRQVFRVDAGAPTNSLYVSSSGNIGIGTSTPGSIELSIKDGDTPTVRLEQDGSSGFTPQTWDIAGNETNFFIRDVTNGSRLPLRIRPGAPESSIDIAASGQVGFGTASPQDKIHIVGSGNPGIRIQTTGGTLSQWAMRTLDASGYFVIRDMVAGANALRIQASAPDQAFEIRSNGSIRMSALTNCPGIQTNATGVLSCTASPSPSPTAAAMIPTRARPAGTSGSVRTASLTAAGTAGPSGSSGSSAGTVDAASDTCNPGDMAGRWKLIGTNIEKFGANSVLWCDVQLTQAPNRSKTSYSISGACRSHAPGEAAPQELTVQGNGSITETAACTMAGRFRIKQGSAVVAIANILEGTIEGSNSRKSRVLALSRMRRGRTSAIQMFVLQR